MAFSELVLGTHNQKKARELVRLLEPYGLKLFTLADFSDSIEVEETGKTFSENAILKATQQAKHLGKWVIGEDSGLCIDALKGEPGIYSARFSGDDATDEKNNALLLERLAGVPLKKRTGHYVCQIAFSDPQGNVQATSGGKCKGRIRTERTGTGGFGYDPLFEIVEYHLTFAELGGEVKSVLSHRARATRKILPHIISLSNSTDDTK